MRRRAVLVASCAIAIGWVYPLQMEASTASVPRSIAALGDSLTAGEGAGGVSVSWSTGTNQDVNSHLRRLDASGPGVVAHNYAATGKRVSALNGQANDAVAAGADYVTILIGTNDVCRTMTPVSTFRDEFTAAIATLTNGLPAARVFVASIPNWGHLFDLYRDDPHAAATWTADNRCPTFLTGPSAEATQRLVDLNRQLAEVCAQHPQCTFDGNAVYNFGFAREDYAETDYFHLSSAGQAALAALTFPLAFAAPWPLPLPPPPPQAPNPGPTPTPRPTPAPRTPRPPVLTPSPRMSTDRDQDGVRDAIDVCARFPGDLPNGCPSTLVAHVRGMWRVNRLYSQLLSLSVRTLPGSRIVLQCSGKKGACGFRKRTIWRTTASVTSLTRNFRGRRILPAATRITVRVTRRYKRGTYERVLTRTGRRFPAVVNRCLNALAHVQPCPRTHRP